jgi:sec-independent protein translocase protein TatA
MGFTSAWHWIVVLLVVVILFGFGKLPKAMGDIGKGIRNFKSSLSGDDAEQVEEKKTIPEKDQAAKKEENV